MEFKIPAIQQGNLKSDSLPEWWMIETVRAKRVTLALSSS
jgi:hypothetical protein